MRAVQICFDATPGRVLRQKRAAGAYSAAIRFGTDLLQSPQCGQHAFNSSTPSQPGQSLIGVVHKAECVDPHELSVPLQKPPRRDDIARALRLRTLRDERKRIGERRGRKLSCIEHDDIRLLANSERDDAIRDAKASGRINRCHPQHAV
jgi:hypothetical protein